MLRHPPLCRVGGLSFRGGIRRLEVPQFRTPPGVSARHAGGETRHAGCVPELRTRMPRHPAVEYTDVAASSCEYADTAASGLRETFVSANIFIR